ncbi:hypothetical protein D3C85_249440 [compost metagenome]
MALYKRPLDEILGAIKTLNNVELIAGEYTFGTPTAVAPDASGTNTSMLVTALNPLSPYDGSTTIRYKRLDLADLLILISSNIKGYDISTTDDFVAMLNKRHGIGFEPGDIVSSPLSLVDGAGEVTLVAEPDSMGWIGTVTFSLALGAQPLSDVITVTQLPGLNYPSAQITKPYASVGYSYWRNMSDYYATLSTVVTGQDSLGIIKDALVAASGDAWQLVGASRFSLDGAVVSYAGPTSGEPISNQDYDNVIIVDLDDTKSLGWSGQLVLHFNDPIVD